MAFSHVVRWKVYFTDLDAIPHTQSKLSRHNRYLYLNLAFLEHRKFFHIR
ncbi:MAG: hypothetical protein IGS39_00505 [Calothrix sp. C42_A2020_038]|nr:hypothetical protein [Calothrix sp. C42_A2020_038]